jgi:hypothetical protein
LTEEFFDVKFISERRASKFFISRKRVIAHGQTAATEERVDYWNRDDWGALDRAFGRH